MDGVENEDDMKKRLKDINKEYLKNFELKKKLSEDFINTIQNINKEQKVLESLNKFVQMLEEHKQFKKEKEFPHEIEALIENYNILKNGLETERQKLEDLNKEGLKDNNNKKQLKIEINSLNPEIILLYKKMEQIKSWLLSNG